MSLPFTGTIELEVGLLFPIILVEVEVRLAVELLVIIGSE